MIDFDDVTKENITEHNSNWSWKTKKPRDSANHI